MEPNSSGRGRIGVAISAAVLIVGAFVAVPATAAPTKFYTPTISPTCRDTGSTAPLAITLTNNMAIGGQGFGSAQITIPAGWTNVSWGANPFTFANPSTQRNWTATQAASVIKLTSGSSGDLVPPQGSITFTFSAKAPTSATTSTWNTAVKQSNNFLGTGNDFTLNKNPKASQPTVTVGQCNAPPVASNVMITGTAHVGLQLTGTYDYSDKEGDVESGTSVAWLRNGVAISGASSSTYTLVPDDAGQQITFQVTPGAATGTTPGAPATSDPVTVTALTTIPCDGTVVHVGDAGQVSITNLDSGNADCQPLEITPTFTGRQLDVDKSNAGDQLNLLVQIAAFDPEVAVNPVPASQVKPPGQLHDGLWCNGSGTAADPYTEPTAPGSPVPEVWCLETQSTVSSGQNAQGKQLMQVSETWLLQGDATVCRCK